MNVLISEVLLAHVNDAYAQKRLKLFWSSGKFTLWVLFVHISTALFRNLSISFFTSINIFEVCCRQFVPISSSRPYLECYLQQIEGYVEWVLSEGHLYKNIMNVIIFKKGLILMQNDNLFFLLKHVMEKSNNIFMYAWM